MSDLGEAREKGWPVNSQNHRFASELDLLGTAPTRGSMHTARGGMHV